jgi:hypothetical protein
VPRRTLAIGDPQASLERFLSVLEVHDALDDQGRLRDDVHLISMGDHFDWGGPDDRENADHDARALLTWLVSHPAEQVTVLVGNHDTSRVGELSAIDDDTFFAAQTLADAAYLGEDARAEQLFFETGLGFPTAELVARDFSTFTVAQRELVEKLLASGRMKLAHAHDGVLYVHAGVTIEHLAELGLDEDARADDIAHALNAALKQAVARRKKTGEPLSLPGLHVPGNAREEGRGLLYHRPSLGSDAEERDKLAGPPPRRRFDPRALPRGLVQVVGHIRDNKCRKLLHAWCDAADAKDGPVRTLIVEKDRGQYAHGVPDEIRLDDRATMIFLDNGMHYVSTPKDYELLDVDNLRPLKAMSSLDSL